MMILMRKQLKTDEEILEEIGASGSVVTAMQRSRLIFMISVRCDASYSIAAPSASTDIFHP